MTQYRFITPNRRGKWYDSLNDAQARANVIGAGFLDSAGTFVPYRGTILEINARKRAGLATYVRPAICKDFQTIAAIAMVIAPPQNQ